LGRKVNPIGMRLGIIRDWDSKWFAEGRTYAELLQQDIRIRSLIRERLPRAGITRITIQRLPGRVVIGIQTARPGIVIGRRGATINALKAELEHLTGLEGNALRLDVTEIENPDTSARVIAENVAEQLERRISHKRAMRRATQVAMRAGAHGIKISCQGRLMGAEMGRREWVMEGSVPLHTLRADIDYAHEEAATTFGRIGVKVWVNLGEKLPEAVAAEAQPTL
jgi:small subunit ribosomal protein S3